MKYYSAHAHLSYYLYFQYLFWYQYFLRVILMFWYQYWYQWYWLVDQEFLEVSIHHRLLDLYIELSIVLRFVFVLKNDWTDFDVSYFLWFIFTINSWHNYKKFQKYLRYWLDLFLPQNHIVEHPMTKINTTITTINTMINVLSFPLNKPSLSNLRRGIFVSTATVVIISQSLRILLQEKFSTIR